MLIEIIKPIFENPIFVKFGILGLFFNSVLSGIISIPSEITISALLLANQDPVIIFIVSAIGGVVGGIVLYYIAYDGKKLFYLIHKTHNKEHYEKSKSLLHKYGWSIITVSGWIPIFSEVIIIIAGLKKYEFKKFLICLTIGRVTHTMAIVYFGNLIFHYFSGLDI